MMDSLIGSIRAVGAISKRLRCAGILLLICLLPTLIAQRAVAQDSVAIAGVTSVTLMDATTDQPVAGFDPITSGDIIDLAAELGVSFAFPTRTLHLARDDEAALLSSRQSGRGDETPAAEQGAAAKG